MVECVEELFLCTFFSYYKLNVVDEEYVVISVLIPELGNRGFISGGFSHLQSFDQFIGKCLAGYIEDFFLFFLVQDKVGNGMHQMGFSKSHASI